MFAAKIVEALPSFYLKGLTGSDNRYNVLHFEGNADIASVSNIFCRKETSR